MERYEDAHTWQFLKNQIKITAKLLFEEERQAGSE